MRGQRAGAALLAALCVAGCSYFPDHHLVHPSTPAPGVVRWSDRFERDALLIHVRGARPQGSGPFAAVIVHPEGGKTADDMQGVLWDLAGRGYVAIAADYERFIDGRYRRNMFAWRSEADASAIVDIARARDDVDPERIGLLGFSQGGVYSLLIAAHAQAGVRAVVSYYPVTDFPAFLSQPRIAWSPVRWWFRRESGAKTDAEYERMLRAASAYYVAEAISAPVLLIHGDRDTTAPLAQSERMAERLRALHKPVRLLVVPGGRHIFNFRQPREAAVAWDATVEWLETHLGSGTMVRPRALAAGREEDAMTEIQTVTGATTPDRLGRTLMHEHLLVGYPGSDVDWVRPGPSRRERVERCVDRIEEMKGLGITAMLDPCPADLGRDVELMAEVAQRTRFQLICATGLYKEAEGATAYWKFKMNFGSAVDAMAELFIRELTDGVGGTGIRAGIIKVGTGHGTLTPYERTVFEAAAKASAATGAPITTHTDDGKYGDDQQAFLTGHGVPAHRIVIGHSCGTGDFSYHTEIARNGSYLGFDRFGLDMLQPDTERVAALARLIAGGYGRQIVVSHDSVWCWNGEPAPREALEQMEKIWNPTHFLTRIAPRLRDAGVTEAQIDALLLDNPRRFFAGEAL